MWRSRFAADPAVIGREIRVDGAPATVVGVLPPQRAYPLKQQIYRAIHLPEHPEFLARPWFTLSWIESAHTLPTVEAALAVLQAERERRLGESAKLGRASGRERVWQAVWVSVVGVSLKKKK